MREQWPQRKELLSRGERERALEHARNNVFELRSRAVYVDLLTDSGTGRMSNAQWRALMGADESYAGSESSHELKEEIRNLFCMPYVLLVNQGRAAETVVFDALLSAPGQYVLGNMPFDTTRINIEKRGGRIIDATVHVPIAPVKTWDDAPTSFLGDADIGRLRHEAERIKNEGGTISCFLLTATCNSNAGQPVSMKNIAEVSLVAKEHNAPLLLDLARYAENAFFIKQRESNQSAFSIDNIVRNMTLYADAILVSGKKDALGNMGGFVGLKKRTLAERVAQNIRESYGLELVDGDGYGGLSGRDMAALAQGIRESTDEQYLASRAGQVQKLARDLHALGVPVLPPGGHAVFVDAGAFLPHLRWDEFPGHALVLALYLEGGVRAVEVGSLMMGRDPDTQENRHAPQELLRLAIPRRLYGAGEMRHVVETFERVLKNAAKISAVRIDPSYEAEPRHFAAQFLWDGIA